jgi:hypothetical protein
MHDPLVRINEQIDVAARRYAERRRRRRLAALGVTTAVLATGIASGASAVSGVGPVADLLKGDRLPDLVRPEPSAARVDVKQADSRGTVWTMRAYRAGDGAVFCVQAPPYPASQGETVEVSCAPYPVLARDLDRAGVFLTVVSPEEGLDTHLVIGLARADVAAVEVTTEAGREVTATMSDVWVTAGDNRPILAFLAVLQGPRPYVDRPLQVRAELADGEVVTSRWP